MGTPLLDVTVDGTAPAKLIVAANEVAKLVVANVSKYTNTRIQTLQASLALDVKRLANITKRSDLTQTADRDTAEQLGAERLGEADFLPEPEQPPPVSRGAPGLARDGATVAQPVALAGEQHRAGADLRAGGGDEESAPSSRTGAAVGGLIGLILGFLAALLWDPVTARLRARET